MVNLDKSTFHKTPKVHFIDGDYHTLIIGATRCGKSRSLVLPSIGMLGLAGESMLLSDPKGELYQFTYPYLESLGYHVKTLDFKDPSLSDCYNIMQPIIDEVNKNNMAEAVNQTWDLVNSLVPSDSKGEKIWTNGEASIIASAVISVICDNMDSPQYQNMTNLYYFIANMCKEDNNKLPLEAYMKDLYAKNPAHLAIGLAKMSEIAPSKTRASFYTSALATLKHFTNPNITHICHRTDFSPTDLGKKPMALFIILPDEKDTYYSLASIIVNQIYSRLVNFADQKGGLLPNRVNFILDEFGNFTKIPSFGAMMTAGAGRRIRLNLFLQSFTQLDDVYGKETAKTIRANCEHMIYLRALENETCKEISDALGKYTTTSWSESGSTGGMGKNSSSSYSMNLIGRSLLESNELKDLERPDLLVMGGGKDPAIMHCPDLSQWIFNDLFDMGDKEHNARLRQHRQSMRTQYFIKEIKLSPVWNRYWLADYHTNKKLSAMHK